jgi:hypothetical protein
LQRLHMPRRKRTTTNLQQETVTPLPTIDTDGDRPNSRIIAVANNKGSRTSGLRIIFRARSRSVCVVSISRSSGFKADFQPLVEPSLPALDILIPSHSTIISSPARYWTCGCGHGGTRYISTSRSVHTWSVNPAAIAGVWGRHCLAEPVPWVGSGWGSAWRKEAWGRQKL